jgi:hypothetical protein
MANQEVLDWPKPPEELSYTILPPPPPPEEHKDEGNKDHKPGNDRKPRKPGQPGRNH